ncbi:4-carboxymuconolactone decarboxylase [Phytohabitans flavus]|uniref:4-carboxymuconolactone decarboxylase n=1 Tax=Phytohabitans flavus TaxID=1076124 RepID=A0A6F8XS33_9ACTN|nr:carboxymuconolactone decarboxylase family protein [Phytohabitans flavus]BCB76599.1 4-carboxymuconolactone decarboxylase [Phytohabitans flavus]
MLEDDTFDSGIELRRRMFGEAGADAQIYSTTELNDKLQEIVTRWCFGDLWSREELPLKNRSMITVAMLMALGRSHELNIHIRGALANGVSEVELREIALHAILYCGIPAGADGIRTLDAILAEVAPDSALRKDAPRTGRKAPAGAARGSS